MNNYARKQSIMYLMLNIFENRILSFIITFSRTRKQTSVKHEYVFVLDRLMNNYYNS